MGSYYEKNNKSGAVVAVGFPQLLTITFIVLKLTKVISWSWLWVLSPLWIPVAVLFLAIIIIFILS